jgi:hypothetical protein
MKIQRVQTRAWTAVAAIVIAAGIAITSPVAIARQKVPPGVASLLPAAAKLESGDWGVVPTEFGKTFTGAMRATFPGRPSSCDFTVGPELRISLKGDTAWEEPPMLDMAIEQFTSGIAAARKSLPGNVANFRKTNSSSTSSSALKEERLPNGELLYIEYTENCAKRPNGTNTVLRGFARKGATIFTFDLWLSAGASEATAMARDMLARFQKFDVAAAIK